MLLLHLGANHQDDDAQDSTLKISIPKVPFADFGLAVISSEAPLDSGFKTVFAGQAFAIQASVQAVVRMIRFSSFC